MDFRELANLCLILDGTQKPHCQPHTDPYICQLRRYNALLATGMDDKEAMDRALQKPAQLPS